MPPLPAALMHAEVPSRVTEVLARLGDAGHEAFLVGGCVRDLLLGKPPKDFDVATAALPTQVQKLFAKVIPTGIQHGTVTVLSRGTPVEVTTYRTESGYVDGRRPAEVTFRSELSEDLGRRDFTINAMAFNPLTGDFRDPYGGQQDLERRQVRCVGTAQARFSEDGLRPLRAVRFAAVLDFTLDAQTEAAIPATVTVFRKVALERVKEEFSKLLTSGRPAFGLELLARTGLLAVFLPEAVDALASGAADRVGRTPPRLEVRLAALLQGLPAPRELLLRLKFPTKTAEWVATVLAHPLPAQALNASDGALRRWVAQLGVEHLADALDLATAAQREGMDRLRPRLEALLAAHPPLSPRQLALNGQAIMQHLAVPPSPLVGEATRFLFEQVLDAPEHNTPEWLSAALTAWMRGRAGA